MTPKFDPKIRMIPVRQINILNPRDRGKTKFAQIVTNIANLGLKKPITVALAEGSNGEPRYDLVCGQGRLEAYMGLGAEEIPAILVEATKEDQLLMSLAENLARRQPSTVELVRSVSALKERGYTNTEIAKKTDLDPTYIKGILQLLAKEEERLLQAVEKGHLPLNIAIAIATSDDKAVQKAMEEAYEKRDLRGRSLLRARRLIEGRRARGKRARGGSRPASAKKVSSVDLLRTFQTETTKQKMVVQKARICETRLLFAISAIKQLFQDDHFVTLLRAEKIDSLPQFLALQVTTNEVQP